MKTIKLIDQLKASNLLYATELARYDTLNDAEKMSVLSSMSSASIDRALGKMSDAAIARALGKMSDAAIARALGSMSGASIDRAFSSMSGAAIDRLNLDVPIVDGLDAAVFQAIGSCAEHLNMASWHAPCGTTHCRAGWHIELAGEAGKELEAKFGTAFAAKFIYEASTGKFAPDFFATNEVAFQDIKSRAESGVDL